MEIQVLCSLHFFNDWLFVLDSSSAMPLKIHSIGIVLDLCLDAFKECI